jgi:15-cis-phytoene synthase
MGSAGADYLGRVARDGEPDRYLSALLASAKARPLLLALAAYSAELRHIPEAVKREPMMGEVRLQWWRDTLHTLAKGERIGHPVADVLGEGISDGCLPLDLLLDVTNARAFDLTSGPFAGEQALRIYLEHTECKLFLLATRVLGGTDASLDLACRAAGEAYGLARVLLDLPHALARGCLRLPVTEDASSELALALRSGRSDDAVRQLLAGLACQARRMLATARQTVHRMPRPMRVAFLPLALVEPYLAACEQQDRDPLHQVCEVTPIVRLCRIAIGHWLGRI